MCDTCQLFPNVSHSSCNSSFCSSVKDSLKVCMENGMELRACKPVLTGFVTTESFWTPREESVRSSFCFLIVGSFGLGPPIISINVLCLFPVVVVVTVLAFETAGETLSFSSCSWTSIVSLHLTITVSVASDILDQEEYVEKAREG